MPNVSNKIKSLLVDEEDYENPQYLFDNIDLKYLKKNSVKLPDFDSFYNLIEKKCKKVLKEEGSEEDVILEGLESEEILLQLYEGLITESETLLNSSMGDASFLECLNNIHEGEYCSKSLNDSSIICDSGYIINANVIESVVNDIKENTTVKITHNLFFVTASAQSEFHVYLYNDKVMLVTYGWD